MPSMPEIPEQQLAPRRDYDCLTLTTTAGQLDLAITGPDKDGDYNLSISGEGRYADDQIEVWLHPSQVARLKEWL